MIRLEGPARVGGMRVAALVAQKRRTRRLGGLILVSCQVEPVAILLHSSAGTTAYHPDGRQMALERVEALHPGTVDALSQQG